MMRFDEENASSPVPGICLGISESAASPAELIPGCGEQGSAVAFARPSPVDQLTTNDSGRNRQATRPERAEPDSLCGKTRNHPGLVSQTDRTEIRRLQAPQLPGAAEGKSRGDRVSPPNGSRESELGIRSHRGCTAES